MAIKYACCICKTLPMKVGKQNIQPVTNWKRETIYTQHSPHKQGIISNELLIIPLLYYLYLYSCAQKPCTLMLTINGPLSVLTEICFAPAHYINTTRSHRNSKIAYAQNCNSIHTQLEHPKIPTYGTEIPLHRQWQPRVTQRIIM